MPGHMDDSPENAGAPSSCRKSSAITLEAELSSDAAWEPAALQSTPVSAIQDTGMMPDTVMSSLPDGVVMDADYLVCRFRDCMVRLLDEKFDEKMSAITVLVKNVQEELENVRTQVTSRLEQLEHGMHQAKGTMKDLKLEMRDMQSRMAEEEKTVGALRTKCNEQAAALKQTNKRVTAGAASLNDCIASGKDFKLGLSDVRSRLTALSSKSDAFQEQLTEGMTKLQELEHSMQFQSNQIEGLKSLVGTVQTEIMQLRGATRTPAPVTSHTNTVASCNTNTCAEQQTSPTADVLTLEQVQSMIEEQAARQQIENNVIIAGIEESSDEDVTIILKEIAPCLQSADFTAHRIGKSRSSDHTIPRLVIVRTSSRTKASLMKLRNVEYKSRSVFFNHDLTAGERSRRKKLVPSFKKLRAAGVSCALVRDRILKDGRAISESEIFSLLQSNICT